MASFSYIRPSSDFAFQASVRARQLFAMLSTLVLLLSLLINANAASGDLDVTYGTAGIAFADFNGLEAIASGAAIQNDGKVVVVGRILITSGGNSDFALARFTTTGALDPSFGNGGLVVTDFRGRLDRAFACALQVDGKILAGGYADNGLTGFRNLAVARYNADGSLDGAFGDGGKVMTPIGCCAEGLGISVQSDAKIVVAGRTIFNDFLLVRYNADGSLDPSFGSGGVANASFFSGFRNIFAIAFQKDGKIIAAGFVSSSPGAPADWAIARYNQDGGKDSSFGLMGEVTTDQGSPADTVQALAIQGDDKIIAAGSGGPDSGVARYNANGTLDMSFGVSGKATTLFDNTALVLQPDGKILVGGRSAEGFGLARFSPSGSLDGTFGSGGEVMTDLNTFAGPVSLLLQADGKVVAAGFAFHPTVTSFVVLRYSALSFDVCLQDDSSGSTLQINRSTGEYLFTTCVTGGLSISGRGSVITRGSSLTLQDYRFDRRVLATFDGALLRGKASVQLFSPAKIFLVSDRNTSDNTCLCR